MMIVNAVRAFLPGAMLLLGVALLHPTSAEGQRTGSTRAIAVSDTLFEIRSASGETYVGTVTEVQADRILVQTPSGTRIEVMREQIAGIGPATGRLVNGEYWRSDSNRTRLFFSPTARSLPAGGGYFGVYELLIPFVAYGVTDRIMLAGGSPFYLGVSEGYTPPIYFTPKVQVVNEPTTQAALGMVALISPDDEDGEFGEDDTDHVYGIVYGVGTVGSSDRAFTAGIGWGYQNTDFSGRPVVLLGGEVRVSRTLKLLTENVVVPGDGGLYSAGVRFFGERMAADVGLVAGAGFCCFPLVNFLWNFGQK